MIDNPVGIDKPIQDLQQLFIDKLWLQVPDSKKEFNHRVFSNEKDDHDYPDIFINGTKDYKRVIFNDNLDVLSWFEVDETQENYIYAQNTKQVGIFFAVNLNSLYPSLLHRAIEESHKDAVDIINKRQRYFKRPYDVIEGKEAYGDFYTEKLKGFNNHPWHVFKVNTECTYTIKC